MCRCRSWQVQHFVAGTALCASPCVDFFGGRALCEPPCADFVAGTESGELEAENWLLCSATLARGVCGKLEAEKWPLCGKILVRGVLIENAPGRQGTKLRKDLVH